MKIPERPSWDLLAASPLFFGAAFVPWAQGGNHSSAAALIALTIGLGVSVWLVGLVFNRRLPQIPLWWYPCFAAIMVSGFIGLGGGTLPDNPFILEHQIAVAERWPGAWIAESGRSWLIACALCLLGFAAGTDILRRHRNWMRLVAILLLIGVGGMAIAGLLAGGAVGWMFQDSTELPGQPFGGFFHYSFAGAYLNLVWPMGFALAVAPGRGGYRTAGMVGRGLAASLSTLAFLAVWTLPTVAARGLSLALLGTLLLAWAESKQRGFCGFWTRTCQHYGKRQASAGLIAAGSLLVVFFGFTVLQPTLRDWGGVSASGPVAGPKAPFVDRGDLMLPSKDPRANSPEFTRRLAWATGASMLPDAGLFGAGPRAWKAIYPAYTEDLALLSFYLHIQFAYNDFLHNLVEWGWIGGGGWIALWLFILWTGALAFWRRLDDRGSWTRRDWIAFTAWLGVGSCVVHAQVDFPLQSAGVLATAMVGGALILADPTHIKRSNP
ncbi:MAG: hypothetical protein GVY36_06170 [Verrucomicrobia bacterium]|jgi:hypothetical protein|nr:hypothetical protein [Verrucomicrobiota bacterium]